MTEFKQVGNIIVPSETAGAIEVLESFHSDLADAGMVFDDDDDGLTPEDDWGADGDEDEEE